MGKLRHVVLFKFSPQAMDVSIRLIEDRFRMLPGQIPEVRDFEWGTDINPQSRAEGFTHCFVLTFRNADERDIYLHHPAHEAFVSILKPDVEQLLVLDYWAQI
jgi:hypothetical protein